MLNLSQYEEVIKHPIYIANNVLAQHEDVFKPYEGKRALIVLGHKSAEGNGSLEDLQSVLTKFHITQEKFENVEQNPSSITISKAWREHSKKNPEISLVIGLGGGSVMDAAKAIAITLKTKTDKSFMKTPDLPSVDVICICTAAGTGSETTPYSIITDHLNQTKVSIPTRVFPRASFIDPRYQLHLPISLTLSMFLDILCHAVESLLTVKTTDLSREASFKALDHLGVCWRDHLKNGVATMNFSDLSSERALPFRLQMSYASVYAGIAITIAGTSICHGLSYKLTYYTGMTHGKACAVFLIEYLKLCKEQGGEEALGVIEQIQGALGFDDFEGFVDMVESVIVGDFEGHLALSDDNKSDMITHLFTSDKYKMHPWPLKGTDVARIVDASCFNSCKSKA